MYYGLRENKESINQSEVDMRLNGPKKAILTNCFITELEPEITIDKKTNRNLCTLEVPKSIFN